MRIGFPNTRQSEGPKIFLSRLRRSIVRQGLAQTSSFLWPFHDISLFNSIARPNYGRPYVVRVDNIFIDQAETCGCTETLNRPIFRAIKKSNGVVFQSHFNRNLVNCFMGSLTVPQSVIPNGVDLEEFSPRGPNMRDRIGVPSDALVLMTSASWRPHKRLSNIVDVFRMLSIKRKDVYLFILGGGAPDQSALHHPRIHYTGHISPALLPAWYRSADLFLFLSWLDSCPNTVIEAIACGIPVVCSNQGGTPEIIERTHGGVVSKADEAYSFGLVDLYAPPSPDLDAILESVDAVIDNLSEYRSRIQFAAVDINHTANHYVQFLENCLAH
jgi:glycosyltransferase involved in cell wall biosynthesis